MVLATSCIPTAPLRRRTLEPVTSVKGKGRVTLHPLLGGATPKKNQRPGSSASLTGPFGTSSAISARPGSMIMTESMSLPGSVLGSPSVSSSAAGMSATTSRNAPLKPQPRFATPVPGPEVFEEELIPPDNFAMVNTWVYRSSFPKKKHFPFLKTLGLRSVLYVSLMSFFLATCLCQLKEN